MVTVQAENDAGTAEALTGSFVDKNDPSKEWIHSLRKRYPIEPELDRVLTRKLKRRSGPGFSPVSLDVLLAGVGVLLRARLGEQPFQLSNARWMSGGSSKLQMAFTLDWDRPGVGREKTKMVLRMEPAESIIETSRLREYQLIKAFEGIVPVPPLFWIDANAEFFPYPALIYGFALGVNRPTQSRPNSSRNNTSGVGIWVPPELRERLGAEFVSCLAKIHTRDYQSADLSAFNVPEVGTSQCAEWGLNLWDRVWEEDCDEDIPLMRLVSGWLRRNMPVLDKPSILHCDYRIGNFLFDEGDGKITAWLDWELGCIGDRHQDVAWSTSMVFGGLDDDGETFLIGGMMSEPQFIENYEKSSGFRINPKTLHWYKIFNNYCIAVMTIGTCYRIASNGKTHQDVLVASLIGAGYATLNQLVQQIEEVL